MEEECKYHAHFTRGSKKNIAVVISKGIKKQSLIYQYRAKHCIKLD